jgi:hypothetical protein
VFPTSANLPVGQSIQLSAAVQGLSDTRVSWSMRLLLHFSAGKLKNSAILWKSAAKSLWSKSSYIEQH